MDTNITFEGGQLLEYYNDNEGNYYTRQAEYDENGNKYILKWRIQEKGKRVEQFCSEHQVTQLEEQRATLIKKRQKSRTSITYEVDGEIKGESFPEGTPPPVFSEWAKTLGIKRRE